jgi:hypothetical protein
MAIGQRVNYVPLMKNHKLFLKTNCVGVALGIAFLGLMAGCVWHESGPRATTYTELDVYAIQDDYVYYPNYECYYSVSRHQYAYREGNRWVARPAPRGVSVSVLVNSPSVRMEFHDSPAYHHAQVAKQYPKNWKPSGAKPDQHEKGGRRDHPGDKREK